MRICVCDIETFYSQDYSLSKMSTEAYVRDPRFEIIGLGIKFENYPTDWFGGERANDTQLRYLLGKHDWSETLILCHNTQFDGAILSWKFGIKPAGWLDTLSMARALHGVDVGGSLGYLSEKYGLGKKGTEVLDALGKRRHHFTDEEMARYGEYCKNDVELTRKLFDKLMAAGFPQKELKVIDTTLRMFIEPRLELDQPLLHAHLKDVQDAKAASIDKLWQEIIQNPAYAQTVLPDSFAQEGGKLEALKPLLMSNPQFAQVLRDFGVEPPMKVSPTTGRETFAFAKTDEGFKALLEHDDVVVQALASARLGVKSTLEETRTQTFIETAKRGVFPVPLKYYGARTGRWSGEVYNLQNLPRSSKLKKAIKAPAGMALIGADLSNIELRMGLWLSGQHDKLKMLGDGLDLYKDFASAVFGVAYDAVTKDQRFIGKTCIAEGQLVLTDKGLTPIEKVPLDAKVWDGVEFVSHDGPIYQGEKDVILYDGLEATPDHIVFTQDGSTCEFKDAANQGYRLAVTGDAGRPVRMGERVESGSPETRGRQVRVPASDVPFVSSAAMGIFRQLENGCRWVQTVFAPAPRTQEARQNTDGSKIAVHQPQRPRIPLVWRAWDSFRVLLRAGSRVVDSGELAIVAAGDGARSYRQQQGVRTGQPSMGVSRSQLSQPSKLAVCADIRAKNQSPGSSVRGRDIEAAAPENVRSRGCGALGSTLVQTKRRVWDILNAGPRHRFTVEDKLVHNCQLALIYGTGSAKLRASIKAGSGVDIGEAESKRIVALYRRDYAKVAAAWGDGERALQAILSDQTMPYGHNGVVQVDGTDGAMLPSGLRMHYPQLSRILEDGKAKWVYKTRKGTEYLYGAKFFQGITQALARIVMAEDLLRVSKRYFIALTVHDALYCLAPETEAESAVAFVLSEMRKPPKWAPDIPLDAEAGYGPTLADC